MNEELTQSGVREVNTDTVSVPISKLAEWENTFRWGWTLASETYGYEPYNLKRDAEEIAAMLRAAQEVKK